MHPAIEQLIQLPPAERIDLVQDLWDSIKQSSEELPIREWHRELVAARLSEIDGHKEERTLTQEEMWAQVDARRGY